MEKNTETREKCAGYNDRRSTDKYWTFLFIVLLIFWVAVSLSDKSTFKNVTYLVIAESHITEMILHLFITEQFVYLLFIKLLYYHDCASDDKFDSHVSEAKAKDSYESNDKFDLVQNTTVNITYLENIELNYGECCPSILYHLFIEYGKNSDEEMRFASHTWGKNWIFDMIVCNSVFLDENHQRSGSIVIWSNVLFCVCLIAYSLASMRTDKMFRALLPVFIFYLMCNALCRELYYVINILYATFYKQTLVWVIPELILFVIEYTKFLQFEFHVIGYILLATPALFFVCTVTFQMYASSVDRVLFYAFFGLSCFLGLVIHYFALMALSCAISLLLDFDKQFPRRQDFIRAWFIVTRYHFGTVCYHATLILPRIYTVFIKNKNSDSSRIDQFYLTLWKIHDLSFMMTAARGYNFSESIKESLKLFTKETPRFIKNCFISHGQIFRCWSTLLVPINSLLVIGLWACGVIIEPCFSIRIWIMYFSEMFFSSVLGGLFDIYADAH